MPLQNPADAIPPEWYDLPPYPSTAPTQNPIVFNAGEDVSDNRWNQYRRAQSNADRYNQEFGDLARFHEAQAGRYGGIGDDVFFPQLQGGGGYYQDDVDRMRLGRDAQNQAYLTPEEQRGIAGDPYNRLDYLNPELLRGYRS